MNRMHAVPSGRDRRPLQWLAIAALFVPLRNRVQRSIEHRFYRRKYDAQQVLARFSASVRDEVNLSRLHDDLVEAVNETMQPTHVSLWLRPTTSARKQQMVWSSTPAAPEGGKNRL